MAQALMRALLTTALALLAATTQAQSIADPTQPPAAYTSKVTAPTSSTGVDTTAAREQRLQAVFRGPGEKRVAVIGGRQVVVGDTIEFDGSSARVAAIDDHRVVLVRGTARETLELTPSLTSGAAHK